jgi:putative transposase
VQLRYRFRLYPTSAQQASLARAFGCARVVFNDGLHARQVAREAGLPYVTDGALSKQVITEAKKTSERAWLGEVSSVVLQQALADLNTAYRNFFNSLSGKRKGKKVSPPRFRSRKDNRQTIRFTRNARFQVLANGKLRLPKVGDVEVRWSRDLPAEPSSVTVIKDAAGRYFASFVVQTTDEPLPEASSDVGVDLGLTHFAVLSDGTKVTAPKFLRRATRKLRKLQQALARKQKGSNRRKKAVVKVARAHARVADTRRDWLHKLSTTIVRENQAVYGRGPVRDRTSAYTAREVRARRRMVTVHRDAAIQDSTIRAVLRESRSFLPLHPHVLTLRSGRRETGVEHPVMDLPVRNGPRSGCQRRPQYQGRRTGGPQRPWSAGKTGTRAGTAP